MTNHVSDMPSWGIVLLIVSFLYSIVFITKPVRRAALHAGMTQQRAGTIQAGIFVFYLVYLAYVSVLSLKGIFDVNSMPPKVMIWAGMPLMIILFGFIGNTPLFKQLLGAITLESLIAVHLFRLLGVFLLYFIAIIFFLRNLLSLPVWETSLLQCWHCR